ncbi:hypothetical protein FA09DRAFT_134287 [Tilletiopsis washingtonensis]|jgi:ribonuclease Z|uniref:ribonuclease Z n=1 Tax=Tilletiopsis washingtonensis TaxID=58919 RepID=A0A316Z1F6_9BASI|nr:hypothetical protein FA09DRAFT_134287 [Tilletiopsis washingtonensis]PWN95607.1 hypothetical protein FA09DRAFT_134287 [Tilletiopsis washingtonensis]
MTLADSGCRTLTVHGPHQLAQHLCSLRSYTQRDQLLLNCNEAEVAGSAGGSQGGARRKEGASAFYKDEHLTVHAVPLVHAGFEDFQAQKQEHKRRKVSERSGSFPRAESRSPLPSDADGEPDWLQLFRPVYPEPRTDGARVWRQLFVPKDQRPIFAEGPAHALSYIVEHPPQRGKFDVQLASALGVPLGPGRATLIKQGSIRFQRPVAWAQMSEQERQDWLQKTQEGKSKKQLKIRDEILQAIENEEVEVQASQVLGETKEGTVSSALVSVSSDPLTPLLQAFMQLYVPSVDFLPSLLSEDNQRRFERYVAGAKDGVKIAAIIHAAPPDVLTDPHYRSFVERFGGEVQHLISSPAFTRDTNAFSSAALSHLRLSHLDPKIWTPIRYSVSPLRDTAELGLPDAQAVQPDLVVPLVPPGRAHAPPSSAPDLLAPLDDALTQAAVAFRARPPAAKKVGRASQAARESAWAEFVRMCQSLRVQVEEEARERAKADDADHGLVLTPLGTGSASPSKYRNVSGTLVHAPGFNGYMLLDAGEGTYGQLCRRFGHGHKARYEGGPRDAAADALEPGRGVDEVLRELRIMFLSHIHGDHHIGAARILAARHKLRPSRPLYLIANRATLDYLREYSHCEPLGITETVLTIDSAYLEFETGSIFQDPAAEAQTANAGEEGSSRAASPPLTGTSLGFFRQRHRDAMASMGLRELTTCKVIHRVPRCFGLVARSARGWSVAYSGDTQPCAALVRAGKDVDVLVHEATLEDSQHEMAKFKGHSTFGQAIDIARQMNAKHCLLTHFSQRYPKLPRLSAPGAASESGKREPIVALAFDLASIAVRDMWKMERYRPALELLFDADEEEGAEGDAPSAADVPGAAADVQMADAPAAAAPISAEDAAEKASAWQPLGPAVDALRE